MAPDRASDTLWHLTEGPVLCGTSQMLKGPTAHLLFEPISAKELTAVSAASAAPGRCGCASAGWLAARRIFSTREAASWRELEAAEAARRPALLGPRCRRRPLAELRAAALLGPPAGRRGERGGAPSAAQSHLMQWQKRRGLMCTEPHQILLSTAGATARQREDALGGAQLQQRRVSC